MLAPFPGATGGIVAGGGGYRVEGEEGEGVLRRVTLWFPISAGLGWGKGRGVPVFIKKRLISFF